MDHGFGQGVIVGITDGSDRKIDLCFDQTLGKLDGQVFGGRNRSSLHLETGGCNGGAAETFGWCGTEEVDVAGAASDLARADAWSGSCATARRS